MRKWAFEKRYLAMYAPYQQTGSFRVWTYAILALPPGCVKPPSSSLIPKQTSCEFLHRLSKLCRGNSSILPIRLGRDYEPNIRPPKEQQKYKFSYWIYSKQSICFHYSVFYRTRYFTTSLLRIYEWLTCYHMTGVARIVTYMQALFAMCYTLLTYAVYSMHLVHFSM